ncbi:PTS sorbitol transporter subunit IIA [Caloramator sp. E03]|uniref:PTS glucitol/sorbitol transporter subunit IIA n=1 Tax=Caloramator sp. E03 TaxID=2576307 RepID=UPI0011104FB2|nr:PTS glucitol/sorbitol transporter subunit IIA [Caloramator sp. E03]QCX34066.1 PTS sorbitol transporter subunit IIA [Caloramator sp. E03]
MKYQSKITGVGEFAFELLETSGGLIIFDNNAPSELAEISVLHTRESLKEDIKVGDKLYLGDQVYIVTAIGEEANHTLRELGHCTLKFSGKPSVELPGEIELKGYCKPNIQIGDMIIFE